MAPPFLLQKKKREEERKRSRGLRDDEEPECCLASRTAVVVSLFICSVLPFATLYGAYKIANMPSDTAGWPKTTCTVLAHDIGHGVECMERGGCLHKYKGRCTRYACKRYGPFTWTAALEVSSPSFIEYFGTNVSHKADICGGRNDVESPVNMAKAKVGSLMPCWIPPRGSADFNGTIALDPNCSSISYDWPGLLGGITSFGLCVMVLCVVLSYVQHCNAVKEEEDEEANNSVETEQPFVLYEEEVGASDATTMELPQVREEGNATLLVEPESRMSDMAWRRLVAICWSVLFLEWLGAVLSLFLWPSQCGLPNYARCS